MKTHDIYQLGNKLYNKGSLITSSKEIKYKNGYFKVAKRGAYDIYDGLTGNILIDNVKYFRVLSRNTFLVQTDKTIQILKEKSTEGAVQTIQLHTSDRCTDYTIGNNLIVSSNNIHKIIDPSGTVLTSFEGNIVGYAKEHDFILVENEGALFAYYKNGCHKRLWLSRTTKITTYKGFKDVFLVGRVIIKLTKNTRGINLESFILQTIPKPIGKHLLECRLLNATDANNVIIVNRDLNIAFRCYSVTKPTYYESLRIVTAYTDTGVRVSYSIYYKDNLVNLDYRYIISPTGYVINKTSDRVATATNVRW